MFEKIYYLETLRRLLAIRKMGQLLPYEWLKTLVTVSPKKTNNNFYFT